MWQIHDFLSYLIHVPLQVREPKLQIAHGGRNKVSGSYVASMSATGHLIVRFGSSRVLHPYVRVMHC